MLTLLRVRDHLDSFAFISLIMAPKGGNAKKESGRAKKAENEAKKQQDAAAEKVRLGRGARVIISISCLLVL